MPIKRTNGKRRDRKTGKFVTISQRKFKGSLIPVGSETGKVLMNSKDATLIINAVRQATSGKVITVEISKETAEKVAALAS